MKDWSHRTPYANQFCRQSDFELPSALRIRAVLHSASPVATWVAWNGGLRALEICHRSGGSDQLEQTKSELVDATVRLSEANKKLGFLESSKARVQVTAYALTDDFGPDPVFSNNAPARSAYAVPKHTLPAEKVLNVALSPRAERTLHANLNDTIVLMSRNRTRKHLARFVDRTAQTETRSVVDVLFADAHEARVWGRRSFYAVNISRLDSPFQR